MRIGAHQSAAGGPHKAVERAVRDQCEALQIFTKNNNRWNQRMWTAAEADTFASAWADSDMRGLVSHASYLINLSSTKPETAQKSVHALADELDRCALLGVPMLVMHPGSHLGAGEEAGLDAVAAGLERALALEKMGEHRDWSEVTILLENTAGQGTNLGWRTEHLAGLLERLATPERFGVCFDTCHAHAAGYDLRDEEDYEAFWRAFDAAVGLDKLLAFHINDSKRELGSRVDRHENIGAGEIGDALFERLVRDERFAGRTGIVETPPDEHKSFAVDVAKLKSMRDAA